MTQKVPRRGRPLGSTNYPDDDTLLKNVAALLYREQFATPTEAFRFVADGEMALQRRIQRKWDRFGEAYLKQAQDIHWEAAETHFRSLRQQHGSLWKRIELFRSSPEGATALSAYTDKLGDPVHPMSLGLVQLFKLMEDINSEVSGKAMKKGPKISGKITFSRVRKKIQSISESLPGDEDGVSTGELQSIADQLGEVVQDLTALISKRLKK
ncbi:MAG: hypothetical protein K0U74_17360 [Alphaproteobacteria bacterium]|nr:hypothetical protein [Alphaproteobacteria bacterium]